MMMMFSLSLSKLLIQNGCVISVVLKGVLPSTQIHPRTREHTKKKRDDDSFSLSLSSRVFESLRVFSHACPHQRHDRRDDFLVTKRSIEQRSNTKEKGKSKSRSKKTKQKKGPNKKETKKTLNIETLNMEASVLCVLKAACVKWMNEDATLTSSARFLREFEARRQQKKTPPPPPEPSFLSGVVVYRRRLRRLRRRQNERRRNRAVVAVEDRVRRL